MALANCTRCGKVFETASSAATEETYCPDCYIEAGKDLKKVIDYLKKNPLASIMEVCRDTGVRDTQISRYVKSGALKIRAMGGQFKCRICGTEIKSGAVCASCREKIDKGFSK